MVEAIIPVTGATVQRALYGDRSTSYRWEVLAHADGVDHLVGVLDGVIDGSASLDWSLHASVKGGGRVRVADLEAAQPGKLRIGDLSLESMRLRPVCVIEGTDPPGHYEPGYTEWGEQRRNVLLNPAIRSLTGWQRAGTSPTTLTPTPDGTLIDFTADTSQTFFRPTADPLPTVPGEWWAGFYTVTVPDGFPAVSIRAWHVWSLGAAQVGSAGMGDLVSIQPGETKIVGVVRQAPEGVDGIRFMLSSASGGMVPGGGRLQVKDALLENADVLGPYFDGDTPSNDLTRHRWLDVAAASESVLETRQRRAVWVEDPAPLPELPMSVFLVSAAVEEWAETGRVLALELLDRCTVPDQDKTDASFAVAAGTVILAAVQDVLASAGEHIEVDGSDTHTLAAAMVWPAGTSKLTIINDLLAAAGYSALWVDGVGAFQATPYVVPAERPITYEVLGIPRELVDGEQSIYEPEWQRDRDAFDVPNKVVAVQGATGDDAEALTGVWTNEDPASPFSYQARGRWITQLLENVDVPEGTPEDIGTFLQGKARQSLIAASAVQATAQVQHLPIPLRVSEVLRFASAPAGIDARHVVTRIDLDAHPRGLMRTNLQEVVDL